MDLVISFKKRYCNIYKLASLTPLLTMALTGMAEHVVVRWHH